MKIFVSVLVPSIDLCISITWCKYGLMWVVNKFFCPLFLRHHWPICFHFSRILEGGCFFPFLSPLTFRVQPKSLGILGWGWSGIWG